MMILKKKKEVIELKKKKKFFFGIYKKKIGYLHIKKSYNNFFLTLTDLESHVICCKTFGTLQDNEPTKKQRKSPLAMNLLFSSILSYFYLYNLKNIIIICRVRITFPIRYLIKLLRDKNIIIKRIELRRKLSYNKGMRGRRIRKK